MEYGYELPNNTFIFQKSIYWYRCIKNLKSACEHHLKHSSHLNEKAVIYLIYGFARSYVILYEDEAVTTDFAQASKEMLVNYMNRLNEALSTQDDHLILNTLNQVSNDYMQGSRIF